MTPYQEHAEGEWHTPVMEGYKAQCCDCGLVHVVDFRVRKGQVQIRVFRNNRSTAQVRRHRNIEMIHEEEA